MTYPKMSRFQAPQSTMIVSERADRSDVIMELCVSLSQKSYNSK
jgi:hypothetical protein